MKNYSYVIEIPKGLFYFNHYILPIVSFIGISGNVLVLLVFYKTPTLRKRKSFYFIMNQSIIDIISSIFLSIYGFTQIYVTKTLNPKDWSTISKFLFCRLFANRLYLWSMLLASSYNLVFLSFERYLSICHPLNHRVYVTKNKVKICIGIVYLTTISYQICFQASVSRFDEGYCVLYSHLTSENILRISIFINLFVFLIIPSFFILFSYYKILKELNKTSTNSLSTTIVERNKKLRKNTIKSFSLVAFIFFLFWTINQGYSIFLQIKLNHRLEAYRNGSLISFSNLVVNPIIYLLKYTEFQIALKKLFNRNKVFSLPSISQQIYSSKNISR